MGVLLVTNQPAALPHRAASPAGPAVSVPDPNDPVEKAYRKLMADDDAAQADADRIIQEHRKSSEQGLGSSEMTLRPRLKQRLEPVRKAYEEFLRLHPDHVNARIAFGSFLNDLGEEEAAGKQWEKACDTDPKNPAAWNNLGNFYGHNGEPKKAMACYTNAIGLSPRESVYHQNLAVCAYMFRKDAEEFFGMNEVQVMNKVMALYRKALAFDPENFQLATELAQTYYGFQSPPGRTPEVTERARQAHFNEALAAWQIALKLARDDIEREGVIVHLARVNIQAGRFEEARTHLNLVTNALYNLTKERLQKNVMNKDPETKALSVPPVTLRSAGGSSLKTE